MSLEVKLERIQKAYDIIVRFVPSLEAKGFSATEITVAMMHMAAASWAEMGLALEEGLPVFSKMFRNAEEAHTTGNTRNINSDN